MLLDCMYVNVKYYLLCVKLFKNAVKICYSKRQCVQPPTGAPPLDSAGRLTFPRHPRLCSCKISLKIPWITSNKRVGTRKEILRTTIAVNLFDAYVVLDPSLWISGVYNDVFMSALRGLVNVLLVHPQLSRSLQYTRAFRSAVLVPLVDVLVL